MIIRKDKKPRITKSEKNLNNEIKNIVKAKNSDDEYSNKDYKIEELTEKTKISKSLWNKFTEKASKLHNKILQSKGKQLNQSTIDKYLANLNAITMDFNYLFADDLNSIIMRSDIKQKIEDLNVELNKLKKSNHLILEEKKNDEFQKIINSLNKKLDDNKDLILSKKVINDYYKEYHYLSDKYNLLSYEIKDNVKNVYKKLKNLEIKNKNKIESLCNSDDLKRYAELLENALNICHSDTSNQVEILKKALNEVDNYLKNFDRLPKKRSYEKN